MALKDNVRAIREELSSQEQLLENIIKSERFFKKHKWKIIVIVIVSLGFFAYSIISSIINESRLMSTNKAYVQLIENPDDIEALDILKGNKPLHRLYAFQKAVKANDIDKLEELRVENNSDLIGSLSSFLLGKTEGANILSNYIKFQEGYRFIADGNTSEAKLIFQTITSDSQLIDIVNALEHYQPTKK